MPLSHSFLSSHFQLTLMEIQSIELSLDQFGSTFNNLQWCRADPQDFA